jgi:polysaccharide biosynthesis transport protein
VAEPAGGLPELVDALRRRWLLTILVALPMFLVVVIYAALLPNVYSAEVVVAFTPRPDVAVGGDTIRIVLPKYVASVTSPVTVTEVAREVGVPAPTLAAGVDASIPADTTNLEIHVELSDPADAAAASTALAQTVLDYAESDDLLTADVVSAAATPRQPSGPKRGLIDAVGLLLAVLAGVVTAFLVERGSPRVRRAEDIVKLTAHPVIGRIPRSRSAKDPVAALTDPAMGAAIRNLRLYLDAELRSEPLQTLAITSPAVGDGKTTVSIALAAAIARLDAKVLLIDGDLRRPRVASALGMPVERSLGDVLTGRRRLADVIQPGPVPGLSVVLSNVMHDVGDVLARNFADVMTAARHDFDVVVVDCPPLLGNEDATTITSMVNGCLLVVSNGSSANVVHQAALLLETLPVRVLGVVLNRARDLLSGYSATYYSRRQEQPVRRISS